MTTLQSIELQCPVCDTRFASQSVVATNAFGGKRTDFHERAAGTQPLPYLMHMCRRCGYSGPERDFTEGCEPSPVVKEHVWNELAPTLAAVGEQSAGPNPPTDVVVPGSAKYEAAAKVAEWQLMEP